jgi:hypothetical protein
MSVLRYVADVTFNYIDCITPEVVERCAALVTKVFVEAYPDYNIRITQESMEHGHYAVVKAIITPPEEMHMSYIFGDCEKIARHLVGIPGITLIDVEAQEHHHYERSQNELTGREAETWIVIGMAKHYANQAITQETRLPISFTTTACAYDHGHITECSRLFHAFLRFDNKKLVTGGNLIKEFIYGDRAEIKLPSNELSGDNGCGI